MWLIQLNDNIEPWVYHYDYWMRLWYTILVLSAIITLDAFVNTFLGRVFPTLECLVSILHFTGFFIFIIILTRLPKNNSNLDVPGYEIPEAMNLGDYFRAWYTLCLHLQVASSSLYLYQYSLFAGSDAAAHISNGP